METGVIAIALEEGVGRVRTDGTGELVRFTRHEFDLPWSQAIVDRPVEFEREPGSDRATRVIGL